MGNTEFPAHVVSDIAIPDHVLACIGGILGRMKDLHLVIGIFFIIGIEVQFVDPASDRRSDPLLFFLRKFVMDVNDLGPAIIIPGDADVLLPDFNNISHVQEEDRDSIVRSANRNPVLDAPLLDDDTR